MNTLRLLMLGVCLICAVAVPAFVPKPDLTPVPPTRHAEMERLADEATSSIRAEVRADLKAAARAVHAPATAQTASAGAPGRS